MVGCMVATSLAMAPAFLLARFADYVDLDGPLLLARDRHPGLIGFSADAFVAVRCGRVEDPVICAACGTSSRRR